MDTRILDGVAVVAPIAAWFGLFGLARIATRVRVPQAAPATPDLGPESPAVVSLLVNHWEISEDAAESTLIDLAARKILEFRQPADDPRQTTVHIRQADPTGLTPYEQRVFARVSSLARGGVAPLTALTFRDPKQAQSWGRRLAAEVITEARRKGLSRRRFGPRVLSVLSIAAAVAGACVAIGVLLFVRHTHDVMRPVLGAGVVTFVALSAIAARGGGERDTPGGHEAAARWLGVRSWLRGHEAFGDQPPAAVGIWDRYLSYGAAVGATRVASAVVDLGMGNRKRVWSSYAGRGGGSVWHRVRVHYPRFWPRYGKSAPRLLVQGIVCAAVGATLVRYWYEAVDLGLSIRAGSVNSSISIVKGVGLLVAFALVAIGAYVIARTVVDLVARATITGEVVWIQPWRAAGKSTPPIDYLAIDEGVVDSTRAWALPSSPARGFGNGDVVTAHVRRWSRRVLDVTVIKRGAESALAAADSNTDSNTDSSDDVVGLSDEDLISTAMGVPAQRGPADPAVPLPGFLAALVTPLTPVGPPATAEEVTATLGIPVVARARPDKQGPMPVEITEYVGPDNKPVLMVVRSGGALATMAMRRGHRAKPVSGLGDEAFGGPGWLAVRRGEEVIMLRLQGAASDTPTDRFLGLAQTCLERLEAHTG